MTDKPKDQDAMFKRVYVGSSNVNAETNTDRDNLLTSVYGDQFKTDFTEWEQGLFVGLLQDQIRDKGGAKS